MLAQGEAKGCLSFTASRFAVMETQDVYNNVVSDTRTQTKNP